MTSAYLLTQLQNNNMQQHKNQTTLITAGFILASITFFVIFVASFMALKMKPERSNVADTATPSDIIQETIKDGVVEDNGDKKFYIDGEVQTNTWSEGEDGKLYYTGVNGRISTGRVEIGGTTYYFNDDGSLYTGWKLAANHWFYFTKDGAATGYQKIKDEYGNIHEYYFDDHGYLVTDAETPDGRVADEDGYLDSATNDDADLECFEYSGSDNIVPGELSGIQVSGEPAEFYMLSIAGETSGGQIVMGDRGRAYGLCQFDYRYDLVDFMKWAYNTHAALWSGFSPYLSYHTGSEELVGNQGIENAFLNARNINYEAAISDELLFMRQRYWDTFQVQMNNAGFHLSERHIAVSAAMFSVNVNCGAQAAVFISNLSPEMSDVELICGTYKLRNTVLAEQAVGRYGRKGTSGRYLFSEPQMALDLYHGYTTIDTAKNYGSGVQWCKNIFSDSVTTAAISGTSPEWSEAVSETESSTECTESSIDGSAEETTSESLSETGIKNDNSDGLTESVSAPDDPSDEIPSETMPFILKFESPAA